MFLSALSVAGVGSAWVSLAQQPARTWRIGWLSIASRLTSVESAFTDEMRRRGYVEGKNLTIDYRWSAGKTETLPALATELVSLKVDLIVAISTRPVEAAMRATREIPILTIASDAVESGFAKSLAHPGGNVTGVTLMTSQLMDKKLQIFRDLVPDFRHVAFLVTTPGTAGTRVVLDHARATTERNHIEMTVVEAANADQLAAAFAAMKTAKAQGVLVPVTPISNEHRARIVALAKQFQLPAIYESRQFVEAGGLLSYGWDPRNLYQRLAYYADRVLQGTSPRDLPIEQATKLDFVVNAAEAKSLGIDIPPSVRLQANDVLR